MNTTSSILDASRIDAFGIAFRVDDELNNTTINAEFRTEDAYFRVIEVADNA